jgi:hypothetical protein
MTAEQRWDALFEICGAHFSYGPCPCPRLHREAFDEWRNLPLTNMGFGFIGTPYVRSDAPSRRKVKNGDREKRP